MADVNITVDGKKLTVPAGTLLIDACRKAGVEIPAFCYYPGLSLQAACRMCLVRIEKMPKLQTSCTTTVAEGMIVYTDTPEVAQARKAMLELLLGNHPLDCPVCDAGGECELQDMTFKYGAGESKYVEIKQHREEQQWSPAVFYDRPRCILCYRCIRMCGEGMDVWALGVQNRGVNTVIAPNEGDRLDCEQCGMCIDVCPVGALTSGSYRYKTRPWEMNHVSTVCAHCGDGCRVTLGVRPTSEGAEIVRADNRDKGGINGDFLCAKGRFGFDFVRSIGRLSKPLIRNAEGKLEPTTWNDALRYAAGRLKEIRDTQGGAAIGVMGSNRATNEENYLLQKFARTVLGTNNIDHERTAGYADFVRALANHKGMAASLREAATAPAILLIGGDPSEEHPLLAWQLRTNVRLNRARLYLVNTKQIKLERQATATLPLTAKAGYASLAKELAEPVSEFAKAVAGEPELLVIFDNELSVTDMSAFISRFKKREGVRFACLADYANSRGAADMGVLPDRLPGHTPFSKPGVFAQEYAGMPEDPGLPAGEMLQEGKLAAMIAMGADPVGKFEIKRDVRKNVFLVSIDLFLSETAASADVVFPAASLYEKTGTVTNCFGDVQLAQKAADLPDVKSELEILVRLADAMGADIKSLVPFGASGATADLGQTRGAQAGEADRHKVWLTANGLELKTSPFDPMAVLDEIQRVVRGYGFDRVTLLSGEAVAVEPGESPTSTKSPVKAAIRPAHNGLFDSGSLGKYSVGLKKLKEHQTKKGENE